MVVVGFYIVDFVTSIYLLYKQNTDNECMLFHLRSIFSFFMFFFISFIFFTEDNEQREHLLNILKQKAEQNAQYKTSSPNGKAFIHYSNR